MKKDPFQLVINSAVIKFITRTNNILKSKLKTNDIEIKFFYYPKWMVAGYSTATKLKPVAATLQGRVEINDKRRNVSLSIPTSGKIIFEGDKNYIMWDKDLSIDTIITQLNEK